MREISYVTLKLTNRCNMNCYMCGQRYVRDELESNDLDIEIIEEQLGQLKNLDTVYLFGGEPLLYKSFNRLIGYLSKMDVSLLMNTNGILVDKYCSSIVENRLRDVTFSIDSVHKDNYEKIRGTKVFDKVISNLRMLIDEKKKKSSIYPHIGVNCVILPENINELEEIYDFFTINFSEIERINFEAPLFTTEKMGNDYEKIMQKNFGCNGDSWKWFYNKIPQYSEKAEKIEYILAKMKGKPKVTFIVSTIDESIGIDEAFSENYVIPKTKCEFPNYSVTILPNGDVTYCTDYPDLIVGNIKDEALSNIFNNDLSEKFRRYVDEKGNLPICSRCPRQRCERDFFIGKD